MRQVLVVLRHEWLYFRTLDRIFVSIGIQTLAPAIILLLVAYFYKVIDLRIPVLIMIIGIPRIPMALTGYAVAGEKVYKTMEALISTPISIRALMLGKFIIPITVALAMLCSASITTLIAANLYARFGLSLESTYLFSMSEWLIIFGNGFFIVTGIIFLTGLLTLLVKVPRDGLFISSLTTFLVGIPYSVILYLYAENALLLSLLTMAVLCLINGLCFGIVLGKLRIPKLFKMANS